MMESKRIEYIDVAKFLAMVLVVFSHGFREGKLVCFLFAFHLPVFYFLNGMTLKLENQTFGEFLSKKLQRYILPMFGLGALCVLLEWFLKFISHTPIPDNFILLNLAKIINQIRAYTIWFLPALFFVDLIMFGLSKVFKDKLSLMGITTLGILGIGISFNLFCKTFFVWNFDASLFGLIFTYLGYLFHHKKCTRFYHLLTDKRIIAFIVGTGLLVVTYHLSIYNYTTYKMHLEMFRGFYNAHYITIPCAIIGCFGFTLLCRGITNFVLAKPVEINLALLATHQIFAIPFFCQFIAKSWWYSAAYQPVTSPSYIAFVITMTCFCIAFSAVVHVILKYSPLSLIVNKPLCKLYRK